jgi:hypothetical protein
MNIRRSRTYFKRQATTTNDAEGNARPTADARSSRVVLGSFRCTLLVSAAPVAKEVVALDRNSEDDTLNWIEAVSEFDSTTRR